QAPTRLTASAPDAQSLRRYEVAVASGFTTMSARVLSTIASNSACSCAGILNLSSVCLQIIHKRFPFRAGDFHVFVRFIHGAPGVFLRTAGGPADHFGNQVFESRRGHAMVRFIHPGIRI